MKSGSPSELITCPEAIRTITWRISGRKKMRESVSNIWPNQSTISQFEQYLYKIETSIDNPQKYPVWIT